MVRRKEILICNPRPKDYAPTTKKKKRRNSSSSQKNQSLLAQVKFLHDKLGNVNLSPADVDYIDVKLRLILNKVSNLS
jgi:hypothetical protein